LIISLNYPLFCQNSGFSASRAPDDKEERVFLFRRRDFSNVDRESLPSRHYGKETSKESGKKSSKGKQNSRKKNSGQGQKRSNARQRTQVGSKSRRRQTVA
jgi:hypothetical protein